MKYITFEQLLKMIKQKVGELRLDDKEIAKLAKLDKRTVTKVLDGNSDNDALLILIASVVGIKINKMYGYEDK